MIAAVRIMVRVHVPPVVVGVVVTVHAVPSIPVIPVPVPRIERIVVVVVVSPVPVERESPVPRVVIRHVPCPVVRIVEPVRVIVVRIIYRQVDLLVAVVIIPVIPGIGKVVGVIGRRIIFIIFAVDMAHTVKRRVGI